MSSATEHYADLLAPIYVWMAGGLEAALARGRTEVQAICPAAVTSRAAVDLGAGFGMHAVPLSQLGFSVLAIDACGSLLEVMRGQRGAGERIETVTADLLSFRTYLKSKAALILCMGDTLTHLPDRQSVDRLFADVAQSLEAGGRFVLTFRDYSKPLSGANRFIPVRSDADRILTCFLEYDEAGVTVHDLLHERQGAEWRLAGPAAHCRTAALSTITARGFAPGPRAGYRAPSQPALL